MVAATTENPVTISTVPVTLDVMKGWKATCVRKASGVFNYQIRKQLTKDVHLLMFNVCLYNSRLRLKLTLMWFFFSLSQYHFFLHRKKYYRKIKITLFT